MKREEEASATTLSGPANATEALNGVPKRVTVPVTRARWTTSMSWATAPAPRSRATRSVTLVCHFIASEAADTFSSTTTS